VLGDEAELAPSFRGFAVGAAAERWRETLLRRSQHGKPRHHLFWRLLQHHSRQTRFRSTGPGNDSAPRLRGAALLPQGPAGSGEAEGAALLAPTQRQLRMVEQLLGSQIGSQMAIEDGSGDVG
jgi:hypothetical protein